MEVNEILNRIKQGYKLELKFPNKSVLKSDSLVSASSTNVIPPVRMIHKPYFLLEVIFATLLIFLIGNFILKNYNNSIKPNNVNDIRLEKPQIKKYVVLVRADDEKILISFGNRLNRYTYRLHFPNGDAKLSACCISAQQEPDFILINMGKLETKEKNILAEIYIENYEF